MLIKLKRTLLAHKLLLELKFSKYWYTKRIVNFEKEVKIDFVSFSLVYREDAAILVIVFFFMCFKFTSVAFSDTVTKLIHNHPHF